MKKNRALKPKGKKSSHLVKDFDVHETSFPNLASLPLLVPDRLRLRFRYSAEKQFSTAFISQPANQVWSHQSVYDPDVTGIGGVCAGIIPWTAIYVFGCVLRSEAKARFVNRSTTPVEVCLIPAGRQTTASDHPNDLEEQPYAKLCIVGGSAGGNDVKQLKTEIKTFELFGCSPSDVLGQRQYWTQLNVANPAVNAFWNTSMLDLTGAALNLVQVISITYDVVLLQKVIDP